MKLRILPVFLVAILAACGGTPAATSIGNPQTTNAPGATNQPAGQVDCAAIEAAAQQLVYIQLLAQLTTPESVRSIRDKEISNLDIDLFLAGMDDLHALDAHASPLGDPKAAIDIYEKAGEAARVLFATEPITQSAIDTYNENVGTVAEFIGHQIAISGAIDEAGC